MKILSLDGGGCWSLIQVRCLQTLYGNMRGHTLLKQFDMVIANSGGSLVLALLAENKKISEIADWFLDENSRKEIFPKIVSHRRSSLEDVLIENKIGPKYSTELKNTSIKKTLVTTAEKYMSQLPVIIGKPSLQLIICSFDYLKGQEILFRSNSKSMADEVYFDRLMHGRTDGRFCDVTLSEAVHASTNSPLNYFDKPAEFRFRESNNDRHFWDGAIAGLNNPVMTAVLEAAANGVPFKDIKVLSIGTGTNLLPVLENEDPNARSNSFIYNAVKINFLNDVNKLTTAFISDPPDSATYNAYIMLHAGNGPLPANSTRFFRFSPLIKPYFGKISKEWKIPTSFTASEFRKLIDMEIDAIEQAEIELIDKLAREWMSNDGEIDNQAIRCNNHLVPVIGYGSFKEAMEAFSSHFEESIN